jgi:hypothetical protein
MVVETKIQQPFFIIDIITNLLYNYYNKLEILYDYFRWKEISREKAE